MTLNTCPVSPSTRSSNATFLRAGVGDARRRILAVSSASLPALDTPNTPLLREVKLLMVSSKVSRNAPDMLTLEKNGGKLKVEMQVWSVGG